MLTIKRLVALALFVSIGVTVAVAGTNPRPFKGGGSGVASGDMLTGSGEATHLGRFTFEKAIGSATDNGDGTVTYTGVTILAAANRDHLHGTFELTIDFATDPALGEGTLTWDGGTGRFDGATGSIAIFTSSTAEGTFAFSGEGNITY